MTQKRKPLLPPQRPMTSAEVENMNAYHKKLFRPVAMPEPSEEDVSTNDYQIKYMVDRFLEWRLPENFTPDAGITFKLNFNERYQRNKFFGGTL
ncbi:MAG TPA: hypothetical protein VNE63_22210 [Candidatus Acidoferrales bacterium]|nr:hypothetical protein [Candidatus Acidoferrales bacterium]